MAKTLLSNITENGLNQGDLVKFLNNVVDVVNELQADHATFITLTSANKTAINAVITAATSDSATNIAAVTPVSASAVSTLTNSTALTLNKG